MNKLIVLSAQLGYVSFHFRLAYPCQKRKKKYFTKEEMWYDKM